MKKILVLSLITLSVLMLTGCGSSDKKEKNDENNASDDMTYIEKCKDCVFAYYHDRYYFGEKGSILTEYTKDYTTLKDENGNQRKKFLGHILDKDGKILRGFNCGLLNDELFCIEATSDGSKHELNVKILDKIYGNEKCMHYDFNIDCYGDVNAYSDIQGLVSISGDAGCTSFVDSMHCY